MTKAPIRLAIDNAADQERRDDRMVSCPVKPLGYSGLHYIYQTRAGDVQVLAAKEHSHMNMLALFGGEDAWLWEEFPNVKLEKDPDSGEMVEKKSGWNLKSAAKWLILQCHKRGRFDVEMDLRGPGVWRAEYPPDHKLAPDDPKLIVHLGDVLWLGERDGHGRPVYAPLRRIGRYVYKADRPLMRPADVPATVEQANELLALIKRWHWLRPTIDPVLLLGWIGVAFIVGSVDWRPSIWLVGDRETGKTTLQRLIKNLLGDILLQLSETTAPALRQLLKGAARPTALDEIEAEETNSRSLEVVKLARFASTRGAGTVARGGADGTPALYNIETVLAYSSILPPPLPSQDLRRIVLLMLGKLPALSTEDARVMRRLVDGFRTLAPKLFRRMVEGWDVFELMLERFQRRLAEHGHSGGACDQFGTLLAAAWVLTHDGEAQIEDELAEWADELHPVEMAARSDDRSDHERCFTYVMSCRDPTYRDGHQRTVGEGCRLAAGIPEVGRNDIVGIGTMEDANRDLGRLGIRVYPRTPDEPGWIAVANAHSGLSKLFEGTHWATRSGKTGGWVMSLSRLPGAVSSAVQMQEREREAGNPKWREKRGNIRFGDVPVGAVMLPLDLLFEVEDGGGDADA